jgi:hypothetical protein
VAEASEAESVYRVVVRRALAGGDPAHLQMHFGVEVLQRYRDQGMSIIRTYTVGRISQRGSWSLDFGIAPDEVSVHVSFADLARLPEAEREHWSQFALLLPASKMFLSMRLSPSACFDDGEVRAWS